MNVVMTVWENRISPVADSAQELLLVEIENQSILGKRYDGFSEKSLFYRARKLSELDVGIFICGAISDFFASLVEGYGIRVIPFIRGQADEVLNAYLEDALRSPKFLMTGYLPK